MSEILCAPSIFWGNCQHPRFLQRKSRSSVLLSAWIWACLHHALVCIAFVFETISRKQVDSAGLLNSPCFKDTFVSKWHGRCWVYENWRIAFSLNVSALLVHLVFWILFCMVWLNNRLLYLHEIQWNYDFSPSFRIYKYHSSMKRAFRTYNDTAVVKRALHISTLAGDFWLCLHLVSCAQKWFIFPCGILHVIQTAGQALGRGNLSESEKWLFIQLCCSWPCERYPQYPRMSDAQTGLLWLSHHLNLCPFDFRRSVNVYRSTGL